MRLAVVGSGYVGLVAAACFAELGHEVVSVDADTAKVAGLRQGQVPIHEEFLPELLARHRGSRIEFSDSLQDAVRSSQAIFIAVGTPAGENGGADLSYVEAVSREVASAINEYKLIVEKSTVPVYTSAWIRRVMLLNGTPADHFDVVSNPEFLREGSAVLDFLYPDRIVVGAETARAAAMMREIYGPLTDGSYAASAQAIPAPDGAHLPATMLVTSPASAELIKHASNAFLALKISFINAVANICDSVGADVLEVSRGLGTDSRIGPGFLQAGIGYGGSCFPKDLLAFRSVAQEHGYDFRLLEEVARINNEQRERFLRKLRSALWTVKGKRLAVLGLAFKGGTDDIRESPAVAIVQALLAEGAHIAAYDPAAAARAAEVLTGNIRFAADPYDAAQGADALVILTDWQEFSEVDLGRMRAALRYPTVVDGRNLFDPQRMTREGFFYYSVGRPHASPVELPAAGPRAAAGPH